MGKLMRGLCYKYSCSREQTVELTLSYRWFETPSFSFPLLKFRSTFIFVQIRTVVYIISPTTKFYAYHGAYPHCLCMQADGQTDGQGATDNEYTPTPIPRGKRYSHRYKCFLCVSFIESSIFGRKITIREPFLPTILFGNLRWKKPDYSRSCKFSHTFLQLHFMEDGNREEQQIYWWQHLIFSTRHV